AAHGGGGLRGLRVEPGLIHEPPPRIVQRRGTAEHHFRVAEVRHEFGHAVVAGRGGAARDDFRRIGRDRRVHGERVRRAGGRAERREEGETGGAVEVVATGRQRV